MIEHLGPGTISHSEELNTPETVFARQTWVKEFIWATAHFPQTYVGIIPLVEGVVFKDFCEGSAQVKDFELSVLSPDQVDQIVRVAHAHDNIPGSQTSHAANPRFNAQSIQDLWSKLRRTVSAQLSTILDTVNDKSLGERDDCNKGEFFTDPRYTQEREAVMSFLARVSSDLRSDKGQVLSRNLKKATAQYYQHSPLLRKLPIRASRDYNRTRKQLAETISDQIDMTCFPELQSNLLVKLNSEH